MQSLLRVRTRHSFGFESTGSTYRHCYELAHMTKYSELDGESEESVEWSDKVEQEYYQKIIPPIHLVEKLSLRFSDQFCYRLSWPRVTGLYLNI